MKKRLIATLLVVATLFLAFPLAMLPAIATEEESLTQEDLTDAMQFDGYQFCLFTGTAMRSVFTVNKEKVAALEREGLTVEYGAFFRRGGAGDAPLLTFDAQNGKFVSDEPSVTVRPVYRDGEVLVTPKSQTNTKSTFVCATEFSDEEAILYEADELLFVGYIGIFDGSEYEVYYFDADSPKFGPTVSLREIYSYARINGYEKYNAVAKATEPIWTHILTEADDAFTNARQAYSLAEEALNDLLFSVTKAEECLTVYNDSASSYTQKQNAAATAHVISMTLNPQLANLENLLYAYKGEALAALDEAITEAVQSFDFEEDATAYVEGALTAFHMAYEEMYSAMLDIEIDEDTLNGLDATYKGTLPTKIARQINGRSLEYFYIAADEGDLAATYLADTVRAKYGISLPIIPLYLAEHADGTPMIIINSERDYATYGLSRIEISGEHFELYGNGPEGAYFATMELLSRLASTDTVSMTENVTIDVTALTGKTYAVDSFFNADGTLNTASTEPLTIVCIGGSLTELGQQWVDNVKAYFQTKFPNRSVTIHNMGVGGSESNFGAMRFQRDVLAYDPDLVIIDFTLNDVNFGFENASVYVDGMINQCLNAEKVPGIIFAHMPYPVEQDTSTYTSWENYMQVKHEVAQYYNISEINIYDYFLEKYEEAKLTSPRLTLRQFFGRFYNRVTGEEASGQYYDVHPNVAKGGYSEMYTGAFYKAFDADLAGMLTRIAPKPLFSERYTNGVTKATHTYNWIAQNDERLTYTGNWEVWTKENPSPNDDINAFIGTGRYKAPFFPDGVRQAYKSEGGATVTFTTSAKSIYIYYNSAASGCEVEVSYKDSTMDSFSPVGTQNTLSQHQQPTCRTEFRIPNTGEETVEVRISVPEPTADKYSFCLGYIIEQFDAE